MNHQRLGVAYVCQVGEDFQVVNELSSCIEAIFQLDGENGAGALRQIFQLQRMVRGGFQARIVDLCHLRMFFQEFCHLLCIVDMAFYAEGQGFEALDEEPGSDRRNRSAGVAEHLRTDAGYKAGARDISGKVDAMIGSIRRSEVRISFRLIPVELAIFNDGAAQCGAVAADEFGGGVYDYIQAMFQWTEEIWSSEGVIDDHRQAMSVSNVADGIEVRDIDGRISQSFDVYSFGLRSDGCFDFFRLVRIYEMGGDAQLRQGVGEEFISAAIQSGSGNDLISCAGDIEDGVSHSRCAGCHSEACGAAFESSQSLFQYILGRVCEAAVNVACIFQCEAIFSLLRIFEYIRSGLINRHRSSSGSRIRHLACMLLKSFETIIFLVCHDKFLLSRFIYLYKIKIKFCSTGSSR